MTANGKARVLRIAVLVSVTLGLLLTVDVVNGQECPDPAPQTSGSHNFRRIGETFDIPIAMGNCQAISLVVRWSNGRNNGGLFNLTFFDSYDRPLYTKQISAFLAGMFEFPLIPVEQQTFGMVAVENVPASVTVQSVYPFGPPAILSYSVTRANLRPRSKPRGMDSKLVSTLQTATGKLLASTSSYSLTEVPLPEPREVEFPGKKKTVRTAYRIQLSPQIVQASANGLDLIWIDDVAVPIFRSGGIVGALIFDDAVLKTGSEVSLSNASANQFLPLPERLIYQSSSATQKDLALSEEGNEIVGIKNAVRVIGGRRQSLVQIQMRTNRPFPAREDALRLQVGKRLFVDELDGDYTGRTLTLTVTPQMFAEIKDGAAVMAFYGKPDASGSAGNGVWYFGRLNKSALQ